MRKGKRSNSDVDYYWQCEAGMVDHSKTLRFGEELGVQQVVAFGMISAIFCRVVRQHPDGDLSKVSAATLATWSCARDIGVTGDIKKALIDAGWCEEIGGEFFIRGWKERYERLVTRRRGAAKRQKVKRGNKKAPDKSHALVTRDMAVTSRTCHAPVTPQEKEKEEEKDVTTKLRVATAPPVPFDAAKPTGQAVVGAFVSLPSLNGGIERGPAVALYKTLQANLAGEFQGFLRPLAERLILHALSVADNPAAYVQAAVKDKNRIRSLAALMESEKADRAEAATRPLLPAAPGPRSGGAESFASILEGLKI